MSPGFYYLQKDQFLREHQQVQQHLRDPDMKETHQPFKTRNHKSQVQVRVVNGTHSRSRLPNRSGRSRGTNLSLSSSRSTLASCSSHTISTLKRNNSAVCAGTVGLPMKGLGYCSSAAVSEKYQMSYRGSSESRRSSRSNLSTLTL